MKPPPELSAVLRAAGPDSSAPAQPLLTLDQAAVRFGELTALQPVQLTLHRGERLALVGANGSGKTTLLRLLHGLLPCAQGQRVLHSLPEGRMARQAMLFQKPFLLSLSVRANLALALWLRGVPAAQRAARVAQALQRVGLDGLEARRATTLSGGQQQRLALARAWSLQPDVLLLDEPTASLDPSAKHEVELLITELAAEGLTVVLSSHNLGQVKRLATRVIYLDGGRVLDDAPVEQFFEQPRSPQAQQFLAGEMAWR
ncbi:MAG: ATP-binding cassette domain-containing protein [Rubrivivax sp.]|nr:ATP-binding cassette domain-containing protein [Rubrivivax sp.]